MPKQSRKTVKPVKEPNPLDKVVDMLEGYERGTPPVKPQACGDCPDEAACRKEDEVDDEH